MNPESTEEFADALIYLAENPDERKTMGLRARKFAEDNFGRQALADVFVAELERVAP